MVKLNDLVYRPHPAWAHPARTRILPRSCGGQSGVYIPIFEVYVLSGGRSVSQDNPHGQERQSQPSPVHICIYRRNSGVPLWEACQNGTRKNPVTELIVYTPRYPKLRMVPIALTIAGSDPGGGAGIQADLKTFHQLGVYGTAAITLITVQNTTRVSLVETLDPALVAEQIDAVLEDLPPQAAKTGALGTAAIVEAVARRWQSRSSVCPLVVDPVMIGKHGAPLMDSKRPNGACGSAVFKGRPGHAESARGGRTRRACRCGTRMR